MLTNSRDIDWFSHDNLFLRTIVALRFLISDAVWAEVEPVLRDLKHAAGRPPGLSGKNSFKPHKSLAVSYSSETAFR